MKPNWIIVLMGVASLIGLGFVYSYLPEQIPVHWNIQGEADGWGPNWVIWILGALPLAVYALMLLLPHLDPKKVNYEKHGKVYQISIFAITMTLHVVTWATVLIVLDFPLDMGLIIKVMVGLLFVVLGNYMGRIRQSFFFGIKTPWTLANEEVWDKTHRLGGWMFFFSGLLFLGSAPFHEEWLSYLTIGGILFATLVPTVYSYFLYRSIQNKTENTDPPSS